MEKKYRIKKNLEIEQILKNKHSAGNKNFIIYKKKNSEPDHFRLAMSVSKKIGNAVLRNRIKRLIKQVFIEVKSQILPFDIFVIARNNSQNLHFDEVKRDIYSLLLKLNVLNTEEK